LSDRVFLDANVLVSSAWLPTNGLLALWELTPRRRKEKNVEYTALGVDHFPSGVLFYFPSGASNS